MKKLQSHWNALMLSLGVNVEKASEYWNNLIAPSYRAPGRYYHNLGHIHHFVNSLKAFGSDDKASLLAAFFHDLVYVIGRKDNEEKSAQAARTFLKEIGRDDELGREVEALILATADHQLRAGVSPEKLTPFLDCDLLILGESAARYKTYAKNIRKEYWCVDDESYRTRRISVMENFLQRESIYRTPSIHAVYESRARKNIANEITNLKSA